MSRHLKLLVLGISASLLAASAEASSVSIHKDRTSFGWTDGGFRTVHGMVWFVDHDKPHHKSKKKQNDVVQNDEQQNDEVQGDENNNQDPITNLDVLVEDNQNTADTSNTDENTLPPLDNENTMTDTSNTSDLFNDVKSDETGPECNPVCDVPCHVVPLPPTVWAGLATMVGAGWTMRKRFIRR